MDAWIGQGGVARKTHDTAADEWLALRPSPPDEELKSAALDALTFGVVVCDADARLVHANAAAEAILRGPARIAFVGATRRLITHVPAETRALTALVQRAARGGEGGLMRLTGEAGEAILHVLVTPLRCPVGDQRCALVALRPLHDAPPFTAATLVGLFGLSATQAAIVVALFHGKSVEEIADERGIKVSTVRTHLAEIFARTGTETQRDLVRMLGSLPPLR